MKTLTAILLSFLLVSCGLTMAERDAAIADLNRQRDAGLLTDGEHAVAVEKIEDVSGNWEDVLARLGTVAGTVLLAVLGVRVQRGAPVRLNTVEAVTMKQEAQKKAKETAPPG